MINSGSEQKGAAPQKEQALDIKDFTMSTGNLSLSEIVGQHDAVAELSNLINSIIYKDVYSTWKIQSPKGIILNGPPGTGKTASVRALAKELKGSVVLMELRYLDIASKWVDVPIEQLRSFFKIAEDQSKNKHVIIFIDELDSMIPSRDNQLHELSMKRVNVFLEWMDGGFSSIENITMIGATNFIEGVDKAARRAGRFDKIVEYSELSKEAILLGLQVHIGKRKLSEEQLVDLDWELIGENIQNKSLSGADLPELINRVINRKVSLHIDNLKKNNFDILSKAERFKVSKKIEFMPSPITTEDFIKEIHNYIKENRGEKRKASAGFSMSPQE